MIIVLQDLKNYLKNVLNIEVKTRPWKKEKELPFFLRNLYEFYEISLMKKSFLLMVAKKSDEPTPAIINKHFKYLQEKWTGVFIYVSSIISSYNRKRLIKYRIPFVVPNKQIYLPDLCLDLREHFRKIRKNKKTLSPATQALIIYALMNEDHQKFTLSELATELGYSSMTMSRALDELESIGIGKVLRKGRKRFLYFLKNKHTLWEQVKKFICNPIKKKILLKCKDIKEIKQLGIMAGLSALSSHSMINPPKRPIYAISIDDWKTFKHSKSIKKAFLIEDADIELEIWIYAPKLFAKKGMADPFSLYLSLRENNDERLEIALEKFMKKIKW